MLIGVLALTSVVATAQQKVKYKLFDLGTLGGPASYISNGFDGIMNDRGQVVGTADTAVPDSSPFCVQPDCFTSRAIVWDNGKVVDLGTLPGGNNSVAVWLSTSGFATGVSQNGEIDPLIDGFPEFRAVLWKDGTIRDLGTLEGGYESLANAVNSRGQVVGFATNLVPDPFSLAAPGFVTTQTRAFLWQNGTMQDLGTLGGSGAIAGNINERGQIAGKSYTNFTPNDFTGIPTVDPFFWQKGKMIDVGTLGGVYGEPTSLNDLGQLVGASQLLGDLTFHPFLWQNGVLSDLGTLGGDTGFPNWINNLGDIAGKADLAGPAPQLHDAVLWRHGKIVDLGKLPGDSCSNALFVNLRSQVVGTSENLELCLIPTGQHAFLWENGGPMVDLNTVIAPGAGLQLTFAVAINDQGVITGFGVPPGCAVADAEVCGHGYVLVPCNPEAGQDCSSVVAAGAAANHAGQVNSLRRSLSKRFQLRKPLGRRG